MHKPGDPHPLTKDTRGMGMNIKKQFIIDNFRISQESSDSGWTMPYLHCHGAHEIYILESGERIVTAGNADYRTNAGDAALFPSNVTHGSKGDTPFSGICIHFSERYLDRYFTAAARKQLMKCFRHKVIRLNENDFATIKNIADHFAENASNNFLILASILDILNRSDGSEDNGIHAQNESRMTKSQKIIEYTDENYAYIKQISDITELFHVSESYVFQVFHKKYHMTPKEYINKLRIHTACHRIKHSGQSMKSIAYDCGFDSYEHFIKVFKKVTGTTPTEYRRTFSV